MYAVFDLESDPVSKWVSQMTMMKCVIDDDGRRTRIESVYIWLVQGVYSPLHHKTIRLYDSVSDHGIEKTRIRIAPIRDILQDMCSLIAKNRYIPLVSHAHDRDMEALIKTDRELNGGFFDETGRARSKVWANIDRVCSQILLRDMCPNYWVQHVLPRVPDTFRDCTLATHVKLLFGREQRHVSFDDCVDLFHLLRVLFRTDGARTQTHLFKNVKGVPSIQRKRHHGGRAH
jgi:hypothetical protein